MICRPLVPSNHRALAKVVVARDQFKNLNTPRYAPLRVALGASGQRNFLHFILLPLLLLPTTLLCMQERIAVFNQKPHEKLAQLAELKIPANKHLDRALHESLIKKQVGPITDDAKLPLPHYHLMLTNNDFVLLVKILLQNNPVYLGVLLPGKACLPGEKIDLTDDLASDCYEYCEWAKRELEKK